MCGPVWSERHFGYWWGTATLQAVSLGASAGALRQWLRVREGQQGHPWKWSSGGKGKKGAAESLEAMASSPQTSPVGAPGREESEVWRTSPLVPPGSTRSAGGPPGVAAWARKFLCGNFREGELGPRGDLILEQMTTESWDQGGAWLRDPIPFCPMRLPGSQCLLSALLRGRF